MCVIIVKPAGVKMPSREILDAARSANQDGCGFVSTFHHKKTLSYRAFLHELSKVKQSEACIIHFRLATHGSVRTANCIRSDAAMCSLPITAYSTSDRRPT